MNKYLVTLSLIALSTTGFAASPLTIINNNDAQLSVNVAFCNDKNNCTLGFQQQISKKGSANNAVNLMLPIGMSKIILSSASLYDDNNNQIAVSNTACRASFKHHQVIVLDSYGTNNVYCQKH